VASENCTAWLELCRSRKSKISFFGLCFLHGLRGAGLGEISPGSIAFEPDLIGIEPRKYLSRPDIVVIVSENFDDLPRDLFTAAMVAISPIG
jgi:hypothetical protein